MYGFIREHVAVKFLRTALFTDPSIVERFNMEAKALSFLNHPNIVSLSTEEQSRS